MPSLALLYYLHQMPSLASKEPCSSLHARILLPSTGDNLSMDGAGSGVVGWLQQEEEPARRLEVVQLPMPAPVVFQGQRLPASYANFYIANEYLYFMGGNDTKRWFFVDPD